MTLKPFSLGTRGSALALAQAEQVRLQMAALLPETSIQLEVIKTSGDRFSASNAPDLALESSIQGIFTKELDEALLAGRIRAAIHSLKDVPTVLPKGLRYGAFLKREDCRDALISREGKKFRELPAGARIGTSSPRREAQLKAVRPELVVTPLRGNLDTRLRRLNEGQFEALVVAGAGVRRLGRETEITEWLDSNLFLPAPAQGVLCLVIAEADVELTRALGPLNDKTSQLCATAERSFLRALQGGCRVPVGALAKIVGSNLTLSGFVADPAQGKVLQNQLEGPADHPDEVGIELAQLLLTQGAGEILKNYGRL